MKRNGFFAFLLGGLIGAVLGLLYAPRSGEETRQMLTDEGQELANKALTAIQDAQDSALTRIQEAQTRLETVNQDTRERIEKLQGIAKNTIEEQKESLVKGYADAKEVVTE